MNNSGASESTEISNTQHTSGVATSERNYDQTVQDIKNQNMSVAVEVDPPIVIGTSFNQQQHPVQDIENPNLEEFDGAPPNSVQRQHTVQDNDPNQNWQGVAPASPSLILQLPDTIQDDGSQTSEAEGTGRHSDHHVELMYKAALEGDWAVAEKLLEQDPTLAYKERNCYLLDKKTKRMWYTPLHVAVALKHDKFTLKLIQRMKPEDLESTDSNGFTACDFAAASGSQDIAKLMIKKNSKLVENSMDLLFLATLSGKSEVVSFFLEQTPKVDPSWKEEWLELLQDAIGTKMYGVALKILEKDGSLATMSNEQGTALHVLARQDISAASTGKPEMIFKSIFGTTLKEIKTKVISFIWKIHNKFNTRFSNEDVKISDSGRQDQEEMPQNFRLLAKKLLAKIRQEMDELEALKLLNKPVPILHDAARVGNMELIHMLTRAYPDLIWQTDDKGRSLLNIAIKCREANVFSFIQRFRAFDISCLFQKDEKKGNNLLHFAAKLRSRKNTIPALQMQSELAWYKAVEAMLSLQFTEDKNKADKTPRDLFEASHKKLLEESKEWMKSTADSCMLIATIILTVVYAAAFTVPGGNNGATGIPILVNSNWLTCFFVFEALALFSSTLCIITFWSISCSGLEEDQFLDILPYQLRMGFTALFGSLIWSISAFLSAYNMVLVQGKAWLVKSFLLLFYVILVLAICGRFSELWYKTKLPECLPQMISKGNTQGGLYRKLRSKTDHSDDESDHGDGKRLQ